MNHADGVNSSPVRQHVDRLLLEGLGPPVVAHRIKEEYGVEFTVAAVQNYNKEYLKKGDSTVHQILKLNDNLATAELPPSNDLERMSSHFSFAKTCDELDFLDERVRALGVLAKANPDDRTYDNRIKDYMAHMEAIRNRVYKYQYEKMRQAVLITTGKKICMAAVSIFLPYIVREHRTDALKRFQSAVEPLLDLGSVPDAPKEAQTEKAPD